MMSYRVVNDSAQILASFETDEEAIRYAYGATHVNATDHLISSAKELLEKNGTCAMSYGFSYVYVEKIN